MSADQDQVHECDTCKDRDRCKPKKFSDILEQEHAAIQKRRKDFEILVGDDPDAGQDGRPANLLGIALSGGGIRSASFCLGALQALDQHDLLRRADYLSAVSGGGYVAASMAAAMSSDDGKTGNKEPEWKFPFSVGADADVSDSAPVGHIRDNSKFLAPRGFYDILISAAILMRGLAVNFLLLLSVLIPLATIVILMNPTRDHLGHSVLFDLARYYDPIAWDGAPRFWLRVFLSDPFFMSKLVAIALASWLIGWALWRSYTESTRWYRKEQNLEQAGPGARVGRILLISLLVVFAAEIQPRIINALIAWMEQSKASGSNSTVITALAAAAGSIIALTASFQATFVVWIERALNATGWRVWFQGMLARAAFYALGLALPLLIYGLFLILVVWGIADTEAKPIPYPYSPSFMVGPDSSTAALLALTLILLMALWGTFFASDFETRVKAALRQRRPWKHSALITLGLAVLAVVLNIAAHATRTEASAQQWVVLTNYLLLSSIALIVAINFTENANGLHRLYRDRLREAFQMERLCLHELGDRSPYLLINGTLNVRRPREEAATKTDRDTLPPTDPAKRGRNAEFFLFSKHFVGSDATEYICSNRMKRALPELDLAAAAAISGAAVSSSMGRIGIGLLGPTLALLNLRLGCWLPNPRSFGSLKPAWRDVFRLYLRDEAFGRLRSDSSRIYVTDGGHLDNIGLYQLLKRQCKYIIVIDAEADSGMNFSAFADVQRFARIDGGVRIDLDWRPVRKAALERLADRSKTVAPASHRLHFAAGNIRYKDNKTGTLIYVKATVTGDEPDYVLDYERRYPNFPHEATSDQFFSEEQMEAYRALGFHATRLAFKDPPAATDETVPGAATRDALVRKLKAELGAVPSIG